MGLLVHADVTTTMIYPHVLQRAGGHGVRSLLDVMQPVDTLRRRQRIPRLIRCEPRSSSHSSVRHAPEHPSRPLALAPLAHAIPRCDTLPCDDYAAAAQMQLSNELDAQGHAAAPDHMLTKLKEWLSLVGGIVALLSLPVILRTCWQDRARFVLEYDFIPAELVEASAQRGQVLFVFSPKTTPDAIQSRVIGNRTLVVTARNLGRRPMRTVKITFTWADDPPDSQPQVFTQSEPFNHLLSEDDRRAVFAVLVPQYRHALKVAVTDDSGEDHAENIEPMPSEITSGTKDESLSNRK